MISGLSGIVHAKNENSAFIDVNGVHYETQMCTADLAKLPGVGQPAELWTRLISNENELTLYGFLEESERQLFDLLLIVNGVGPRVALNVLGAAPVSTIVSCITEEKAELFPKVARLGPKTVKKIILELKNKVTDAFPVIAAGTSQATGTPVQDDIALQALVELGYDINAARAALAEVKTDDPSKRVKEALKNLSSRTIVTS